MWVTKTSFYSTVVDPERFQKSVSLQTSKCLTPLANLRRIEGIFLKKWNNEQITLISTEVDEVENYYKSRNNRYRNFYQNWNNKFIYRVLRLITYWCVRFLFDLSWHFRRWVQLPLHTLRFDLGSTLQKTSLPRSTTISFGGWVLSNLPRLYKHTFKEGVRTAT